MTTKSSKNDSPAETRRYIDSVVPRLRDLFKAAENRRRTVKARCASVTLRLLMQRADAVRLLLQNGGSAADATVAATFFQEEVYEPVIEYWTKVLGTRDEEGEA